MCAYKRSIEFFFIVFMRHLHSFVLATFVSCYSQTKFELDVYGCEYVSRYVSMCLCVCIKDRDRERI